MDEITTDVESLTSGQLDNEEQSLLEQIAAQRAEIAADRTTFLLIPGYVGLDILAQYRLPEGKELEPIAKRSRGNRRGGQSGSLWQRNLAVAMDTMALACTGIYYQRDEDKQPKPLTVGGEAIVNFGDPRIAQAFKLSSDEAGSVRRTIVAVFKGNDIAVSDHAMQLNSWFTGQNSDLNDEMFTGEA